MEHEYSNKRLAELLGWRVEKQGGEYEYYTLAWPTRTTNLVRHYNGSFCDDEETAWAWAPAFDKDITAALWAWREAEKRSCGQAGEVIDEMVDAEHSYRPMRWLLTDNTAAKLAHAAWRALEEAAAAAAPPVAARNETGEGVTE